MPVGRGLLHFCFCGSYERAYVCVPLLLDAMGRGMSCRAGTVTRRDELEIVSAEARSAAVM